MKGKEIPSSFKFLKISEKKEGKRWMKMWVFFLRFLSIQNWKKSKEKENDFNKIFVISQLLLLICYWHIYYMDIFVANIDYVI